MQNLERYVTERLTVWAGAIQAGSLGLSCLRQVYQGIESIEWHIEDHTFSPLYYLAPPPPPPPPSPVSKLNRRHIIPLTLTPPLLLLFNFTVPLMMYFKPQIFNKSLSTCADLAEYAGGRPTGDSGGSLRQSPGLALLQRGICISRYTGTLKKKIIDFPVPRRNFT